MYRSSNIVRAIKSRRLRWAGHVSEWRIVGVLSEFVQVNFQERDLYEGLIVDGGTILEWALKK